MFCIFPRDSDAKIGVLFLIAKTASTSEAAVSGPSAMTSRSAPIGRRNKIYTLPTENKYGRGSV